MTWPSVCFASVLSIAALIVARVLVLFLAFTLQTSAAAALFQDTMLLTCLFNSIYVLFFVQIALCPDTSTVIAVYMCDEQPLSLPSPTSPPSPLPPQSPPSPPSPLPPPQSPLQAWPGGAHIQATYGSWSGHDVAWSNRSITVVAEV